MAQIGDIIARLFSGGGSRGLSGGSDRVLPAGAEHGVFNDFLQRHRTDQDLIKDPTLLWNTSTSVLRRKGGLSAHLAYQKTDSLADFTDVLFILNPIDGRRARPVSWRDNAMSLLRERFEGFCQEEDYHLQHPLRHLGFRFIEDGGPEMDGYSLGMKPGEFVTGLLPNQYSGPGEGSKAVIAVLVNLPGHWQGYREIGRLYNDQLQFTLGNHWLDSYHHAALQRPLMYRLQQNPDGSLMHVIHPDLQETYRVKAHTAPDGVSVLTLVDGTNRPMAHVILSVIEEPSELGADPTDLKPPGFGPGIGIQLPSAPARQEVRNTSLTGPGHRTVVPLDLDERIFRLHECGALLQKVHFNKFMGGYDVYLDGDGSVQTSMSDPAATFQVRGRQVSLCSHRAGLLLNGQVMPVGQPVPLRGDAKIGLGAFTVDYLDLSVVSVDGWPYLGEIRRAGGNTSLVFGGVYRIGRDRSAKVRLPDEPENENIHWLPGIVEGAMIRSRTGDIPKSRFYTDSIMVASLHAELDLRAEPELTSLARHCHTFVRRGGDYIGLHPVDKQGGLIRTRLRAGDEILVGNCVFEVTYPPPDSTASGGADEDAGAEARDLGLKPPPLSPDDLPAAAGLGERGPPPPSPATGNAKDTFDNIGVPVRGAQLALAGSAPSSFGDSFVDRKTGPRLVFDEDFDAPFRKEPAAPPKPPSPAPPVSVFEDAAQRAERPERPVGAGFTAAPLSPAELEADGAGVDEGVEEAPATEAHIASASAALDSFIRTSIDPPQMALDASMPPLLAMSPPMGISPPSAVPLGSAAASGPPWLPASGPATPPPVRQPAEPPPPEVWVVEEEAWQLEMARPARLVLSGWMVSGDAVVTNYYRAGVALPENKSRPEQRFEPVEYFQLRVRGANAELHGLGAEDARLLDDGAAVESLEGADAVARATMVVTRRDDKGAPDFELRLTLVPDPALPDPRAQRLAVDLAAPMAAALLTLGLPLRASREVTLGPIRFQAEFGGERLRLGGFLPTYRLPGGGFHPFFVRRGEGPWRTAPEDGSDIELEPGDRLMAGSAIYVFERA